ASEAVRQERYLLRHEVYAMVLGQHVPQPPDMLHDELDKRNSYLVASVGGQIAGFISITPPPRPDQRDCEVHYSIDKYLSREVFSFPFDDRLHEIRLLTVLKLHRGRELATMLMYDAFGWVE